MMQADKLCRSEAMLMWHEGFNTALGQWTKDSAILKWHLLILTLAKGEFWISLNPLSPFTFQPITGKNGPYNVTFNATF